MSALPAKARASFAPGSGAGSGTLVVRATARGISMSKTEWNKTADTLPPIGMAVLMLCNAVPPVRLGYMTKEGVWFTDTAQQCFPIYWSLVTVPPEIFKQVQNGATQ